MTAEWLAAVRRHDVDGLRRLLESGADIDALDKYGQTGLMLAALHGRSEVVTWLVERGAALDRTAKYGLSAVMLAALNGRREIVRTLVQAGADLTLRGTGAPGFAGKTALDLAVDRARAVSGEAALDNDRIVEILRRGRVPPVPIRPD